MSRLRVVISTHDISPNGELRLTIPHPFDSTSVDKETRLISYPFADIKQNITEAWEMGPFRDPIAFYRKVQGGGDWDYKRHGREYENFGNWHFGVVAAAAGWNREIALRGAGAYQLWKNTSKWEYGMPWDIGMPWSNFGDDPNDQWWIKKGYDAYEDFSLRILPDFQYWDRIPYIEYKEFDGAGYR